MENYDAVVIGAGPAGISASLYLKRANKKVLVLYKGESNIEKANLIENYYGFPDGITGIDLYNNGIKQALNLGIEVREELVLDIKQSLEEKFEIKTYFNSNEKIYCAKNIVLATGNKKLKPLIDGIEEYDGKGISYCTICDGFFYKNKNVVVIGNANFAMYEAKELKNIAKSVKILTNGEEYIGNIKDEEKIEIINKKINKIKGSSKVEKIDFEDGSYIDVDGIFIALGEASTFNFAKKLGVLTLDNSIKVNEKMLTNVDGIYACGNATGGTLQISKAVYEGMVAGLSIVNKLDKD